MIKTLMEVDMTRAGTDLLGFHHPLNKWSRGSCFLPDGERKVTVPLGTDERHFCRPPDPAEAKWENNVAGSNTMSGRTDVERLPNLMRVGTKDDETWIGCAGTEVQGFLAPPDG